MNIAVFTLLFTMAVLILLAAIRDPLLNYYQKKNKTELKEFTQVRTKSLLAPVTGEKTRVERKTESTRAILQTY